jgi:hypothetical protein
MRKCLLNVYLHEVKRDSIVLIKRENICQF